MDWAKLNTNYFTSKEKAFEELCCVIAEDTAEPPGTSFIRVGLQDGGVECFKTLPDGREFGWQAKFFLNAPNASQWSQISRSAKRALKTHPRLVRYTVCLPVDLPDARREKVKTSLQKWEEHVRVWRELASKCGTNVEFVFWGEHDFTRYFQEEGKSGLRQFWFNEITLNDIWFINHITDSIASVGLKYSSALNVDLDISKYFHGLTGAEEYFSKIFSFISQTYKAFAKARSSAKESFEEGYFEKNLICVSELDKIRVNLENDPNPKIEVEQIEKLLSKSMDDTKNCVDRLKDLLKDHDTTKDKKDRIELTLSYLNKTISMCSNLEALLEGNETALYSQKALLLTGSAGIGKTHLLCNIAERRAADGYPTLLLHGINFGKGEPWGQIISQIGLDCVRDDFLQALDLLGRIKGRRVLILVDALNESDNKNIWSSYLRNMLSVISRYDWISIAFSVRDSYMEDVVPNDLLKNKLVEIIHPGFSGKIYLAVRIFFKHYGISLPKFPILIPEFRNPLFLKMFCEGLRNRGLSNVPPGYHGISSIFQDFINSVDVKISKKLDYDPHDRFAKKAIEKLAEFMGEKGERWISRTEAKSIVNSVYSREEFERSLFRHLMSEGILIEERILRDGDYLVRFSFEKFSDHLIAGNLIDRFFSSQSPIDSLGRDTPLGKIFTEEHGFTANRGIIEALSIQLPERFGIELVELLPDRLSHSGLLDVFVESIIWRDISAFDKEKVNRFINEAVFRDTAATESFLNALITLSSVPDHLYNSYALHNLLKKQSMPLRDAFWSTFIHYQYYEDGAVVELLDSAFTDENRHLDDEAILLKGITLSWFLTSSNRFLRDRATKALVSIFTERIHLLKKLLELFHDVNDPYVIERLLAASYGCLMRNQNGDSSGILAQTVYDLFFRDKKPPVHILLRDYARQIVELALFNGASLDILLENVRPSYNSKWPRYIPEKADLVKKVDSLEKAGDKSIGHLSFSIFHSDFARYILGKDLGVLPDFSQTKYGEDCIPDVDDLEDGFSSSIAQSFVMDRVLKMGWTQERFGRFDSIVDRGSFRQVEHKAERIGKKYQWIAFHELLARLSDNFILLGESFHKKPVKYDGPWQVRHSRDIDPSLILSEKRTTNAGLRKDAKWWATANYRNWHKELDDIKWLKDEADYPDVAPLLNISGHSGKEWLCLEGYYVWQEPEPNTYIPAEDHYPKREIWLTIRSYITKKEHIDELYDWAIGQDWGNRWMPESHERFELFLGEFFWSPAYKYYSSPYFGHEGWTRGSNNRIPHPILVTAEQYLCEGNGYDCSIEDSVSALLPGQFIFDGMGLKWDGKEQVFLNSRNEISAMDPSLREEGPSVLLVEKEGLLRFLQDSGYEMLWTTQGEKQVIGIFSNSDKWPGRLSVNGAARLKDGRIKLNISSKFSGR